MCGTFGKPQGILARAHIGKVIMSIFTKLQNKEPMQAVLSHARVVVFILRNF